MRRETQLQAQALSDGVQAVLNMLSKPKDPGTLQKQKVQEELRRRAPVSPERRMLLTGFAAAALLISFTTLCGLVPAYGMWACWRNGYPQVVPILLAMYALAEACFSVAWRRKYDRFNVVPTPHAPKDPNFNPRDAFNEFIVHQSRLSRYIRIKDMIETWFWNTPLNQIKKGNVADLILYGFWYKSREDLEAEGQGDLPDQLVRELEKAWGMEFEGGHNSKLEFMAHLWQPLRCSYRPLIFYVLIEYVCLLKHVVLLSLGFRTYEHAGFKYYIHGNVPHMSGHKDVSKLASTPAPDFKDPSQVPILFLHGVGVGLLPYIGFICRLAITGQPVIAFECPHLGMRWVPHIPEADEVVAAVRGVLRKHDVPRVCVSGHSYGTFHASRFLQLYPQLVQSICLIDPVNFNMFTGKLIHNFVYRPDKATSLATSLVARDIHHAASVCRRFYWSVLNLWPHQLPRHTLVVLSGRDELVPVPETITMLQQEAPQSIVVYRPDHKHAQFINDDELQKQVVKELVHVMRTAEHLRMQVCAQTDSHQYQEERTAAQQQQHDERVQALEQYRAANGSINVGGTALARVRIKDPADTSKVGEGISKQRDPVMSPLEAPVNALVGVAERCKSGSIIVEVQHNNALGELPRSPSGRHTFGGTTVRTLGDHGVVALERTVNEDHYSTKSGSSLIHHSHVYSRGSLDFGESPQSKEGSETGALSKATSIK